MFAIDRLSSSLPRQRQKTNLAKRSITHYSFRCSNSQTKSTKLQTYPKSSYFQYSKACSRCLSYLNHPHLRCATHLPTTHNPITCLLSTFSDASRAIIRASAGLQALSQRHQQRHHHPRLYQHPHLLHSAHQPGVQRILPPSQIRSPHPPRTRTLPPPIQLPLLLSHRQPTTHMPSSQLSTPSS